MPDTVSARPPIFGRPAQLGLYDPRAYYTTGEDHLRVVSLGSVASVVLTVAGRFMGLDGEVRPFRFAHTPSTDRTTVTTHHGLAEGWILDCQVLVTTGAPQLGQTWVSVRVVRGLATTAELLSVLVQGSPTAVQPISYPGSPVRSTLESEPSLRVVTGTDPAAGAQISETVPTGARWQLLEWAATLVSDATAGSRRVRLEFVRGGVITMGSADPFLHDLSTGRDHFWFGQSRIVASVSVFDSGSGIPMHTLLRAGDIIRTALETGAAGDNWSAPTMVVREWLVPE
ncbi:MAG: hypothetical protein ACRDHY_07995 [Anaerolineales bacterium]